MDASLVLVLTQALKDAESIATRFGTASVGNMNDAKAAAADVLKVARVIIAEAGFATVMSKDPPSREKLRKLFSANVDIIDDLCDILIREARHSVNSVSSGGGAAKRDDNGQDIA